jgi:hypothetical protein
MNEKYYIQKSLEFQRRIMWQQVRGELLGILEAYWDDNHEEFERVYSATKEFIQEMDNEYA